jgi:hypothetical protein
MGRLSLLMGLSCLLCPVALAEEPAEVEDPSEEPDAVEDSTPDAQEGAEASILPEALPDEEEAGQSELAADLDRLREALEKQQASLDEQVETIERMSGDLREAKRKLTPSDAVKVELGGQFQSDLRFRLDTPEVGSWYNEAAPIPDVARNQNLLKLKLNAESGRFAGVADVDLVFMGYPAAMNGIGGLSERQMIDPHRLEAHSLYIEGRDVFPGMDLRIGQQLAQWGVGDQFNPTNSANANDVEDRLLFGDQLSNFMVRADYTMFSSWTLSSLLIPVFKPALLPSSGVLGLMEVERLPFWEDELRWRVHAERETAAGLLNTPTVVSQVNPAMPETSLGNMQYMFRLGGWVGMQDVAVSYYKGFADVPQATTTHSILVNNPECNPADEEDCINGVLHNTVGLEYTPIQVVGLNLAGEVNPLGWIHPSIQSIGYRIEAALIVPERLEMTLTQDALDFALMPQEAGEYEYGLDGAKPTIVSDTPFMKWAIGLDYTFGRSVYMNAQWVHGMFDEMGAESIFHGGWVSRGGGVDSEALETSVCSLNQDGTECAWEISRPRIGDYLVTGADISFANKNGLLRIFTLLDLGGAREEHWDPEGGERVQTFHGVFSEKGFSAVIFPELSYNFGNGFELGGGVLLELGQPHTKFGDPAAGGSVAWTRARYSF